MQFEGKHILITGASSGIGRQVAVDLANQGAYLYLMGRDEKKLTETLKFCPNQENIELLPKDLTDSDLTSYVLSRVNTSLDGIVLNAGIVKLNPVSFIQKDDVDEIFNTNVISNVMLLKALLRRKKVNKNSSIVFVSSIATRKPTLGNSVYNASKSALNGFAHSLALEVAAKGIRVNTILPGYVETNILGRIRSEEEVKKHLTEYPLGRFGSPHDISNVVCFLLSDASTWITGAQIPVDGGFSMK